MGCSSASATDAEGDTKGKAYHELSEEEKERIRKQLEEDDKNLKEEKGKKESPEELAKFKFDDLIKKLPTDATEAGRKERLKLWNKINEYGNGYLSYKRLETQLCKYLEMPFSIREKGPIRLAFNASCNRYAKKGAKLQDNLLEWNEFRIFLVYLRQYFEYYVLFKQIDKSDDQKIQIDEFKKAVDMLKKNKVEVSDPDKLFKTIDKDGSGEISFVEFCKYAIEKSLSLEDDSFDDAELKNLK